MISTIKQIEKLIAAKDLKGIRNLLTKISPADIADAIEELDPTHTIYFIKTLKTDDAAEVFAHIEPDRQEVIIKAMTSEEIKELTDEMFSDDVIDVIEELPANLVQKVLKATSKETRKTVNKLLKYDDDTSGAVMTTEFVELSENLSCAAALKALQKLEKDQYETFSYIYLVDAKKSLTGYVMLEDLVFASPKKKLKTIAKPADAFVEAKADQELAANTMKKYDLSVIPVVNGQHKLVGILTADDIIDIIEEEATEDIHRMAAVAPSDKDYLRVSVFSSFRGRIKWLLILMVTATFTQLFIDNAIDGSDLAYEGITLIILFAGLIPLMMDTAGNAGGQSGAVIIRALSLGEITTKDYLRVLWKEVRTAFLIAVVIFVVNYGRIVLLGEITGKPNYDANIAIITSAAIFVTIIIAKALGATMPMLAQKLKLDPATVAAPLITTVVDLLALVILFVSFYFGLNYFI